MVGERGVRGMGRALYLEAPCKKAPMGNQISLKGRESLDKGKGLVVILEGRVRNGKFPVHNRPGAFAQKVGDWGKRLTPPGKMEKLLGGSRRYNTSGREGRRDIPERGGGDKGG